MKKKIFTLSSLIIFIVLCSISLISDKEKTKLVFNKVDEYYYNFYLINTSKYNLNTKNIFKYIGDIKVIKIYPNTNSIYKNIINIEEYEFNSILSSKKNISNFINMYNAKLKENAFIKELDDFNISGIKINKIKVYASGGEIENLFNLYPNFVIEETSENH